MSSGFITESEAVEARRIRQEEWEKVRTPDQPLEAPEEVYDNRPLFTRLEEQRLKKEAEYEEAHKLKNMIRGLDDDEVGFLDLVEETKAKVAQQITLEEQKEMREFRERVSKERESEEMLRLRAQIAPSTVKTPPVNNSAQKNMLQGIVVRKRKAPGEEEANKEATPPKVANAQTTAKVANDDTTPTKTVPDLPTKGAMKCVALLPGLGPYTDTSSETDSTSDSDDEPGVVVKRDLCGRREEKKREDKIQSSS